MPFILHILCLNSNIINTAVLLLIEVVLRMNSLSLGTPRLAQQSLMPEVKKKTVIRQLTNKTLLHSTKPNVFQNKWLFLLSKQL